MRWRRRLLVLLKPARLSEECNAIGHREAQACDKADLTDRRLIYWGWSIEFAKSASGDECGIDALINQERSIRCRVPLGWMKTAIPRPSPPPLVWQGTLGSLEPGTVDDGRPSCWPMLLHIRFVAGGSCGCRPVSWGRDRLAGWRAAEWQTPQWHQGRIQPSLWPRYYMHTMRGRPRSTSRPWPCAGDPRSQGLWLVCCVWTTVRFSKRQST